jgi:hypothetical protein
MPVSLAPYSVLTYAPSPPPAVGAGSVKFTGFLPSGTDEQDGGAYRVTGTTKVKGTPDLAVSCRVRLHDQLSGRVVREVWSTAGTGAYSFKRIRMGTFYVISLDHTGAFRAVIADGQIPELIA